MHARIDDLCFRFDASVSLLLFSAQSAQSTQLVDRPKGKTRLRSPTLLDRQETTPCLALIHNFLSEDTCYAVNDAIGWTPESSARALTALKKQINASQRKGHLIFVVSDQKRFCNFSKVTTLADVSDNRPRATARHLRNLLTLQAILEVWDSRAKDATASHLLILFDGHFSRKECLDFKKLSRDDVALQGLCQAEPDPPGLDDLRRMFWSKFLEANECTDPGLRKIVSPAAKKFEKKAVRSPQTEIGHYSLCFEGNPKMVELVFGLKVGFASFGQIEEAGRRPLKSAYFVGRTAPVYDETTQQIHRYPDGFGVIFRNDGVPVGCGTFSCGYFQTLEPVGVPQKGKADPKTKKVVIFPDKSIFCGTVINGVPAGEGTLITQKGSTIKGVFKQGAVTGVTQIDTYYGARWEGVFKHGRPLGQGLLTFQNPEDDPLHVRAHSLQHTRRPAFQFPFVKQVQYCVSVQGETIFSGDVCIDKSGNYFFGRFENSAMNGLGLLLTTHGYTIEAKFVNDQIEQLTCIYGPKMEELVGHVLTPESEGIGCFVSRQGDMILGLVTPGPKLVRGQFYGIDGSYVQFDHSGTNEDDDLSLLEQASHSSRVSRRRSEILISGHPDLNISGSDHNAEQTNRGLRRQKKIRKAIDSDFKKLR